MIFFNDLVNSSDLKTEVQKNPNFSNPRFLESPETTTGDQLSFPLNLLSSL